MISIINLNCLQLHIEDFFNNMYTTTTNDTNSSSRLSKRISTTIFNINRSFRLSKSNTTTKNNAYRSFRLCIRNRTSIRNVNRSCCENHDTIICTTIIRCWLLKRVSSVNNNSACGETKNSSKHSLFT